MDSGNEKEAEAESKKAENEDTNNANKQDGMKAEEKGKADSNKIKAAIDQAFTALKNMEDYHNESIEKTKEEKKLHAGKVIKCLENVRQQCGKEDAASANGILDYAKRNEKHLAGVAKGKNEKRYGSDKTAKEIINKIREKLRALKSKKVKE